jgi:hypothetical protein
MIVPRFRTSGKQYSAHGASATPSAFLWLESVVTIALESHDGFFAID